jgi:hypothetical protein
MPPFMAAKDGRRYGGSGRYWSGLPQSKTLRACRIAATGASF